MLYSPIMTAVIDVYILLLELQRVMNWKMQFMVSSDRACSGIWRLLELGENEQFFTVLLYYTEKDCEAHVCIQDFLPFKDALI